MSLLDVGCGYLRKRAGQKQHCIFRSEKHRPGTEQTFNNGSRKDEWYMEFIEILKLSI